MSKIHRLVAPAAAFVAVLFSASASAVTVPGTGVGSIPDGAADCNTNGAPLVVSFAVAGLTANTTGVSLDVTMNHTWVGDVTLTLAAPGGSPNASIVTRIGRTGAGLAGDSSNYGAAYTFNDTQSGDIWAVAASSADTNFVVTAGGYRSSGANAPTFTSLNPVFAGLTPAQANGTWTLSVTDGCAQDTGAVTAAALTVTEPLPDNMFADGFEEPPVF